ncbi:thioredoxin family protein [bacterium]|nr:thioredoxin family protein [bacterium]
MCAAHDQGVLSLEEFQRGLSWEDYNKLTSSPVYNQKRFDELDDQQTLDFFRNLELRGRVVVMTMAHCRDCTWSLPLIARLLEEAPNLEYRFFLRDDHPELMDMMEYKGKRSVPRIAYLNESGNISAVWGPRPKLIQEYVDKSVGVLAREQWFPEVLKYYRSKGREDLFAELRSMFASVVQDV